MWRFRGRVPATSIYLFHVALGSFASGVIWTTLAVYYIQVAGLNPLQLILVGTALESTYFLFEVPTGVIADTYSRRLSIIIGVLIIGIAYAAQSLLPFFAALVIAEGLRGIGETFTSGATEAWVVDEVGEARVTDIFLRGAQAGRWAHILGIPVSVTLASAALHLPLLAGGLLYLAQGSFLVLFMPERGFRPAPRERRPSWQAVSATLRAGLQAVRGSSLIWSILALAAIYGMASEGFDRLNEAHFLANLTFPAVGGLTPVVWFGIMDLGAILLSLGATGLLRRRLPLHRHGVVVRLLLAMNAARMALVLAFAFAGSFAAALAAFWGVTVMRTVARPIFSAWVTQQVINPQVRATVISISSQADSLGQIAGGPAIGALGVVSLRAALAAAGLVLAPSLWVFARVRGRAVSEPVGEEAPA